MESQDNLISKEFLLELNRLVSLKELQLELLELCQEDKYRCAKFGRTSIPAGTHKQNHENNVSRRRVRLKFTTV